MVDVSALTDLPTPLGSDYVLTWRGTAPYRLSLNNFARLDTSKNAVLLSPTGAGSLAIDANGAALSFGASFYSGSWRNLTANQGGSAWVQSTSKLSLFTGTNPGAIGSVFTDFTEKLIVDNLGNLGVGRATALAKFHVGGDGIFDASAIVGNNTDGWGRLVTSGGALYIQAGSLNSGAAAAQPIIFGNMFGGVTRAVIRADGSITVGSSISLGTTQNGNFQICQSGSEYGLVINNRDSSGASQTSEGFVRNGAYVGAINTTATATSYVTSSDYRLKKITGPLKTSGAFIDALKPVVGTWKLDGSVFVGFIAHEVQAVASTPVATGVKDGETMQGLDYSSAELIANMVAELQALRARVADMESRLADGK